MSAPGPKAVNLRARERHQHPVVDGLKVLDPKRPIREADMAQMGHNRNSAAKRTRFLLNYLVGDGEHAGRNVETESLGGLQVDDELELSRQKHR